MFWVCSRASFLLNMPKQEASKPEPPQMTPFSAEEQWLPPDGQNLYLISKTEPNHPIKETHFSHLYLQSYSFAHYPNLVTICEISNQVEE